MCAVCCVQHYCRVLCLPAAAVIIIVSLYMFVLELVVCFLTTSSHHITTATQCINGLVNAQNLAPFIKTENKAITSRSEFRFQHLPSCDF